MTTAEQLPALYDALVQTPSSELLGPIVERSGGVLLDATREDIGYRPGHDAHVRIAATVDRAGVPGREGWVVCAGGPEGTFTLESPAGRLSAWRVRDDPSLPALHAALDVPSVAAMLGELGVPAGGLALQLLAYRPRRRAVVVATTPTHQLFLKCVPPDKAEALHRRHTACQAAGVPVPKAVGYDPALGLLVLTPLRGSALRAALLAPPGAALPAPAYLVQLLDTFADVELDDPARSPTRQARGHAALLRAVLPSGAAQVDELLGQVRSRCDGDSRRAVVHGDLHDDQLLVTDGVVTGVVDVDGAGIGHPADDAANLLAHLLVLRTIVPGGAVAGWLPEVHAALTRRHDPDSLQARTAAVLLGLATWPHSQQSPDWQERTRGILALAEQVLAPHGTR